MPLPIIRPVGPDEVELMLDWAASEGWNPGLDDAHLFYRADPTGFFMAFDGQRPVAVISVVSHDEGHGFLGLYICHPDYRGHGYGLALWKSGMKHLGGKVVGLDGVVEQQENYRRSGFELAYRNIRFAGDSCELMSQVETHPRDFICRPYTRTDWPEVLRLDTFCHGYRRHDLLSSWVADSDSRYSAVGIQDGGLRAFGSIRQCVEGYKVGPLEAASADQALGLLRHLVERVKADSIILDVPEPNEAAVGFAQKVGLSPVFETARMYKGSRPHYQLKCLFGVTSFELG